MFKLIRDFAELEEPGSRAVGGIDHDVDIAQVVGLVARNGAEQRQMRDAEPGQLITVVAEAFEDIRAVHNPGVGPVRGFVSAASARAQSLVFGNGHRDQGGLPVGCNGHRRLQRLALKRSRPPLHVESSDKASRELDWPLTHTT